MKQSITLLLVCLTCLNLSIMAQNNGDVQDSVEYKRISFMPDDSDMLYMEYYSLCDSLGNIGWDDFIARYHPWVFSFDGDTLCIKGVYPLNCFSATAECKIQGTIIDISLYQSTEGMDELPDCEYDRLIDVRIPGFKAGTYVVSIFGQESQVVVCNGKQERSYIPFVTKMKQWHVLGFSVGPYISKTDYFFQHEEVSIGEHTYMPLYSEDKTVYQGFDKEAKHLEGFFREEDRRVYRYDEETAQEYCVYDFTLEVGDTFNIDIEHEANLCVVTKVDYMNVKDKYLKTITFSSVNLYNESQMAHVNHTWVEGFGDTSNPTFGWIPNTNYLADPAWSSFNVAYMVCYNQPFICPLSIFGSCGGGISVIGQELVSGEGLSWEEYKEKYQGKPLLDYEITGGQLHVKGYMWLASCSPYYIYCKLSPKKDSYTTYKITLQDEAMGPESDCISTPHAVDLYFDIPFLKYDNNYNFVYEDEDGEHPVINRDKYQPFVAEGKVWKVGLFWNGSNQASEVEFYCLEGDTIVGDRTCKKWMLQTMSHENRKAEYIGAVYEEDGRVYEFLPGRCEAVMLYDFATPVGEWVEVYDAYEDRMDSCYIAKRDTVSIDGYLLRQTTVWSYPNDETTVICETVWTEGIGNNKRPNYNTDSENPGDYHWLMACTTADDMLLYQSPTLYEDISEYWRYVDDLDKTDAEARKEKLDFTHVIKTRPTAPACYATGISLLWGEYDNTALTIGFGNMGGTYTIAVLNVGGEECFFQKQETANLQSLDISLANFATGDYTIAVENDDEAYTAHFALPFDGNGISEIKNEESISKNYYDLTGRKVSVPSVLPKGVYLHNKRKVIIHE